MIRPYLAAGRLLHLMTAVELVALFGVALSVASDPLRIAVSASLCLLTLFTQLDARSRYQEYKKMRDQLILYGPNKRIFKSVFGSRCRRDAALAAAKQVGLARDCSGCFASAGYRWYHLIPDFLKNNPKILLSEGFWRTTFFLPTYKTRFPIELSSPIGSDCAALNRLT